MSDHCPTCGSDALRKALRHYQFGPRGWAARMALQGGLVDIDPETPDQAAGGPFAYEAADYARISELEAALRPFADLHEDLDPAHHLLAPAWLRRKDELQAAYDTLYGTGGERR